MIDLLKTHPFFSDKPIESCTLLEHQGYCNKNYLVIADEQKYIVRRLLRNDIDRVFEWRVLGLAYAQGITAEPLVFDEEGGFMVFSFLEGEHQNVLSVDDLTLLAQTLQKLHSITIDAKPIEIQIQHKTDEVLKAFETIEKYPKEYVLCHNDLNPKNIFFTDEIKLIDFEYAGVNDRYFDLACICVEFGLDNGMQKKFLESYFKGESFSIEKLEAYKTIYVVLCKQWFENN